VALTAGAEGATLATGGRRVSLPSVPALVCDTIGAGDSFMAMLVSEALAHRTPRQLASHLATEGALIRLAQSCLTAAAITVSRPGADPPTRADVERR